MVTRRSAASDAMNLTLALQGLGPWACRHGTCFASQPGVTCTPCYLPSRMGVASCPSGELGQIVVPVFGWANQGLKESSTAQGHRTQGTRMETFVPTMLANALFAHAPHNAALHWSHRDPCTRVPGRIGTNDDLGLG